MTHLYVPVRVSSMTLGSRSTRMALGTCLPVPVSWKKVEKESSPGVLSLGIQPVREKVNVNHLSVRDDLDIGSDAVLKAVVPQKLAVTNLDAGLANVNAETLPHGDNWRHLDNWR